MTMRHVALKAPFVLFVAACAGRQPAPAPAPTMPNYVDISLVSSMIGPAKTNGAPWDGFEPPSSETTAKVSAALMEVEPYAAITALFAGSMMQGIVPPEPFGTAQMLCDVPSLEEPRKLISARDTLTPQWIDAPTWSRVALSSSIRLHVELIDDDVSNDDPIGTFELGANDFEAALASGHVYQVRVADQTYNQILFAGITVRPSRTTNDAPLVRAPLEPD